MTEFLSWLTALLVVTSVIVKIVTANLLTRAREELAKLLAELRKQNAACETVVEQRQAVEDNLELFERRLEEDTELRDQLEIDLEACEAAHRKHLEELGYDPDEDIDPETITPDGDHADREPAGKLGQPDALGVDTSIAILPPTVGDSDKSFLPDTVTTELLALGVQVVDRSTVNQRLAESGMDLRHVLAPEEYYRLHELAGVDAVAIINSRMMGSGIGTATCRLIHFPS